MLRRRTFVLLCCVALTVCVAKSNPVSIHSPVFQLPCTKAPAIYHLAVWELHNKTTFDEMMHFYNSGSQWIDAMTLECERYSRLSVFPGVSEPCDGTPVDADTYLFLVPPVNEPVAPRDRACRCRGDVVRLLQRAAGDAAKRRVVWFVAEQDSHTCTLRTPRQSARTLDVLRKSATANGGGVHKSCDGAQQPHSTSFVQTHSAVSPSDARFEATSARAALEVAAQTEARAVLGLKRNFMGIIKGVLSPILDPIGQFFGGTILGPMIYVILGLVGPGVSEGLQSKLPEALFPQLAQVVLPGLRQTVSASVTERLPRVLSMYLAYSLTPRITNTLVERLVSKLVRSLTLTETATDAVRISKVTASQLTQLLTKSVSHATVAAVTHSMRHTPAMQSVCGMCERTDPKIFPENGGDQAQKKAAEVCRLCSMNDARTYYSLYYAGYYSSYYASYYDQRSGQKFDQEYAHNVRTSRERVLQEEQYDVLISS